MNLNCMRIVGNNGVKSYTCSFEQIIIFFRGGIILNGIKVSLIMSSVHRQPLRSLEPGRQNALIIGIIVNSFNMKTIDAVRTRCRNVFFPL